MTQSPSTIPAGLKKLTAPQRIKWLRKQAGSHDRLAAKIGTTRQVIIGWEKGQHKPRAASRQRLAEVSGLPAAFFRDGNSDDEDDEESELMAQLVGNLRALVRAELAKREEVV